MNAVRSVLLVTGLAVLLASCGSDTPPVRTVEMGRKVMLGHITYTVFDTQWLPQIGTGATARVPQNRFFLVRLSAVNGGGQEELIPNLTLMDDHGNSFEESEQGEGVPQWIGFLRKAKPAESVDGNIVFDVAPQHYRLKITDENGDQSALVDIPLSFTSESPDGPLPKQQDVAAPQVISPSKK